MKSRIMHLPDHGGLAAKRASYTDSQKVLDRVQAEAIAACRSDPRPDFAAEIVFAELYALIDGIEAEQNVT
ncbi:hypothetical protein ACYZTM_16205 [Pseudomonas sp. MDT2-39-1]